MTQRDHSNKTSEFQLYGKNKYLDMTIWVLRDSLCSRYELIGVVPIGQQVSGLLVINTDVVVLEHTRKEVINLPRYIQDVLNSERDEG